MSVDRLRDAYAAYHRAYVARDEDPDALVRTRLELALVLGADGDLDERVVAQVVEDARAVLQLA